MFWVALSAAWLGTAIFSGLIVLYLDALSVVILGGIAEVIKTWTFQTILVGSVASLALYIFNLPEGHRVNTRTALSRAFTGSVFGYLAAKLAAGFNLNDSLQAAASGAGGAKGPQYIDTAMRRLVGSGREEERDHHQEKIGDQM